MASTITEVIKKESPYEKGIVCQYNFVLDGTNSVYANPDFKSNKFTGYASAHIIMQTGAVTMQIESDNTGVDANFSIPVDSMTMIMHPALCTAQTTSIIFESVMIPAALRSRWKVSSAEPTTGSLYLFLSQGV